MRLEVRIAARHCIVLFCGIVGPLSQTHLEVGSRGGLGKWRREKFIFSAGSCSCRSLGVLMVFMQIYNSIVEDKGEIMYSKRRIRGVGNGDGYVGQGKAEPGCLRCCCVAL